MVSIHAPARGATIRDGLAAWRRLVSIHAPARGATSIRARPSLQGMVSIHAPARGATDWTTSAIPSNMFQSTPPRGGRQCRHAAGRSPKMVSIHAPARGATRDSLTISTGLERFQSTPPRGGRPAHEHAGGLGELFQSTPPRGGRPVVAIKQGGDAQVSIHAPARGATSDNLWVVLEIIVSIHAPARGATYLYVSCRRDSSVSIHAPARGATWRPGPLGARSRRFNPRPRAGGDPRGPSDKPNSS